MLHDEDEGDSDDDEEDDQSERMPPVTMHAGRAKRQRHCDRRRAQTPLPSAVPSSRRSVPSRFGQQRAWSPQTSGAAVRVADRAMDLRSVVIGVRLDHSAISGRPRSGEPPACPE